MDRPGKEGMLMDQRRNRSLGSLIAIGILAILLIGCFWLWKSGYLSSQQQIEQYLQQFGILAPLAFIVLQAVQVVVPIMPGGVSCLAGVLMFGAWKGFFYNYAGICIGSVIAFLLARKFGMPLLRKLFSGKLLEKYQKWMDKKHRFTLLFFLAIFLPAVPDDFLCFLAGTTAMPLKVFMGIILLGKPVVIAMYSLVLTGVFNTVLPALTG